VLITGCPANGLPVVEAVAGGACSTAGSVCLGWLWPPPGGSILWTFHIADGLLRAAGAESRGRTLSSTGRRQTADRLERGGSPTRLSGAPLRRTPARNGARVLVTWPKSVATTWSWPGSRPPHDANLAPSPSRLRHDSAPGICGSIAPCDGHPGSLDRKGATVRWRLDRRRLSSRAERMRRQSAVSIFARRRTAFLERFLPQLRRCQKAPPFSRHRQAADQYFRAHGIKGASPASINKPSQANRRRAKLGRSRAVTFNNTQRRGSR
jgi:hypothetical protein